MTNGGEPGTERYPGETLDLLRAVHGQLAELMQLRRDFAPLLDSVRDGRGLLGMARAARRQNGAPPNDDTPGAPGATLGDHLGPGLWGRARGARHPGESSSDR